MLALLCALVALAACRSDEPVVAVIGAGPAGVGAAIEATTGARVVLFEGQSEIGGLVAYGSGITALADEDALARWDEVDGEPNPARTRYVRGVETEFVDWFTERGVRWRQVPHGDDRTVRLLAPERGGITLVGVMAAELAETDVELRLDTRVVGIERGEGFLLRTASAEILAADAVVLATGSAVGNVARVRELIGMGDGPLLRGAPDYIDGHGAVMAGFLGGVEREPAQVMLYARGVPHRSEPGRSFMLLQAPGMVVVDSDGRLLDEVWKPRGDKGRRLMESSAGHGWVILPAGGQARVSVLDSDLGRVKSLREVKDHVKLHVGADLAALERKLGLEPGVLETAGLLDLAQPPRAAPGPPPNKRAPGFVALAIQPTTAKALTGLETDLNGRVLDADGSPIPGLYAAGELAGFGHAFDLDCLLDSSMVGGAFLTGRVAGRAVLQDWSREAE